METQIVKYELECSVDELECIMEGLNAGRYAHRERRGHLGQIVQDYGSLTPYQKQLKKESMEYETTARGLMEKIKRIQAFIRDEEN